MRRKTKQGTGRRVQREGGREERRPQGLGNQSEGEAGAEVRGEEVGSVCHMKGSASRTVHSYRDNGMLAGVHPRKHRNPEDPEFKRKSAEQHGYRSCQVQRARPTPAWGAAIEQGSLQAAGASGGAPPALCSRPVLLSLAEQPGHSLQASPGGCFLCFADRGPHPLF